MNEIELPEMKDYDSYKEMPPQEKKRYVRNKTLEILEKNKDRGVSIGQIMENTYFSRDTISSHLNTLVAKGQAYKHPYENAHLYFPNGRLGDPVYQEDIKMGNKIFSVFHMSNQLGDFIYIQEKEVNIVGEVETNGGIMVPYNGKDDFIEKLNSIVKREMPQ